MARLCKANEDTRLFTAKPNVESEVKEPVKKPRYSPVPSPSKQASTKATSVDELPYPSPAFLIGVCFGNTVIASHFNSSLGWAR